MKKPRNIHEHRAVIASYSTKRRALAAKRKLRIIVDNLGALITLNENNNIASRSYEFSEKVPLSFAAHTFNVFRMSLNQFEIIRLCSLWDDISVNRNSIPTVLALIDNDEVRHAMFRTIYENHAGMTPVIANIDEVNEEERAAILEMAEQEEIRFAEQQVERAKQAYRESVDASQALLQSEDFKVTKKLRDRRFAHSLFSRRTQFAFKSGLETKILEATIEIVQKLVVVVCNSSYDLQNSREIAARNAHYLWDQCEFNVVR